MGQLESSRYRGDGFRLCATFHYVQIFDSVDRLGGGLLHCLQLMERQYFRDQNQLLGAVRILNIPVR